MSVPTRVAFDVNVPFSWVGWQGSPIQCVELAREQRIVSISCDDKLGTLVIKLTRKLNFDRERLVDILEDLLSFKILTLLPDSIPLVSGDPENDIVIACASVSESHYIVSGDKKHLLPLKTYKNIQIISPSEFLLKTR